MGKDFQNVTQNNSIIRKYFYLALNDFLRHSRHICLFRNPTTCTCIKYLFNWKKHEIELI